MKSILSIFKNIFTVWGISEASIAAIHNHSFSRLFIEPNPLSFSDDSDDEEVDEMMMCPICENPLNLSNDEFDKLKAGEEFLLVQKTRRKLVTHQCKHHPDINFWPCAEKEYRIMDKKVSVLFMCQKMLARASLDHSFDCHVINSLEDDENFSLFKAKMAFLFGCAAGDLSVYSKALKNYGTSSSEKDDFIREVKSFLETFMIQALSFDWRTFLLLEQNSFLRLNCMKIFFRCGFFAEPAYPCFVANDLENAASSTIIYHPRDVLANQKASIQVIYRDLYTKNRHFVSTYVGSSAYGEVTEGGVTALIEAMKKHFLPLMSPQERRHLRLIDVGAGLSTTIMHFAQKIHGFYGGIENDPIRSRIFAESFRTLIIDHHEDLGNMKLAYMFEDLQNVRNYDFDIVYSFDEVFTVQDWRKLMRTFLASSKAKFWITFKPLKSRRGSRKLLEELVDNGLVQQANVSVRMKVSGEVSNAGFFVKPHVLEEKAQAEIKLSELHDDWAGCKPFWSEDKEEKLEAINKLLAQLNDHLEDELHDRKRKKVRKNF